MKFAMNRRRNSIGREHSRRPHAQWNGNRTGGMRACLATTFLRLLDQAEARPSKLLLFYRQCKDGH